MTVFAISSSQDGVLIDTEKQTEVDLDELFEVIDILSLQYDMEDKKFYFLCNSLKSIIGFYLIAFDERDPISFEFICRWQHKLNIGDANMFIMRGQDKDGTVFKELVVSYKTIFINTFNVVVQDLSTANKRVLLKHEAF